MENIDEYLSKTWNSINKYGGVMDENFWDICRRLESKGFLDSDDAAISAISIGPFKIASDIDIKKKEFLAFFLEIIIPTTFSKMSGMSFEQVYTLYLLPVINIFISLSDRCFCINDLLQWEILLYLKEKNSINIYPTVDEIKKSAQFKNFEGWQIEKSINELKNYESLLGDKHNLITLDYDGRIESLV